MSDRFPTEDFDSSEFDSRDFEGVAAIIPLLAILVVLFLGLLPFFRW
jgi:hypothetical protein